MQQAKDQIARSPEHILQLGMGFWASKVLLTAVKFDLFSLLADGKTLSATELKQLLLLDCTDRHVYDFLDTLTTFGLLERSGLLNTARYSNSRDTELFLVKNKPSYIGGILEMANNRLYPSWSRLENSLLTGASQNDTTEGPDHSYHGVYKSPEKLREFINAMSGVNMGNFTAFAKKFDFGNYDTLVDVGGSGALLSIIVSQYQPQIRCTSLDLPPVEPVAISNIEQAGLSTRVKTASRDFFADDIPSADIVVMGSILHNWDEEKKLILLKKAYNALPIGGAFVAIENIIDEERRKNAFGLMMSLNMLVQTGKGFDYTFSDFNKWAKKTGFQQTTLLPLAGAASAVIAYK